MRLTRQSTRSISFSGAIVMVLFSAGICAEEVDASKVDVPEVHKEVQAALDWTLPENKCRQPKPPGRRKEVNDDQGGTRTEWDADSYTVDRYERKLKRWQTCVERYKRRLSKDFENLKGSAQHGLTQPQADVILGKMKTIQSAILAPDGIPAAPEN